MFSFANKCCSPKTIDLNSVLRNLSNMIARLLGEDLALKTNYTDDLAERGR